MRRGVLFSELFDDWVRTADALMRWSLSPSAGALARRERVERGQVSEQPAWAPAVDILESPQAVLLVVEVPGVAQEDVELELHDQVLTVRGEKRFVRRVEGEEFHRAECLYGRFERSFALGTPVDAEGIRAWYRDGLLRVRLPKAGRAAPRRIQVEVE